MLELVIPFGIFGPRKLRLFTFAAFTLFQIVNAATANYGFFCYLAVVLGVFLLDDADVERARARHRPRRALRARDGARAGRAPRPDRPQDPAPGTAAAAARRSARRWAAVVGAGLFALVSVADANVHFGQPAPALAFVNPLLELNWRFHLVNSYHLFASITRERIEPEFQTLAAGPVQEREAQDSDDAGAWTAQHFRHKPGDVARAPDFVAPHQPRVDFRLWFYGLAFQRRMPAYVSALLERLCERAGGRAAAVPRAAAPPSRRRSPGVLAVSVHHPRRETRHPAPGGDGRASRPCVRYPARRSPDPR